MFFYQSWINRNGKLDKSLRNAATELGAAVELGPLPGQFRIPDSAAAALAPAEIASLRYAVIEQDTGAVADRSSASLLHELRGRAAGSGPLGGFNFYDAEGKRDRGYAATVVKDGVHLRVLVSSATLNFAETLAWMQDEALNELVPVLAPLFIGTLLIAPFTIRHSLKPLDRLSAQAAMIEPTHTDLRLKETGIPSEILPLVGAFNSALARIDEGFELQRRFTSNAAHELRTPLAILRARNDGLEDGSTKTGLIKDVERMTRLVSQLLLAGRLEMQPPSLETEVDLTLVARETVERLAMLHTAREHELVLSAPDRPVVVRGDAESLGDALRNLIDNALAHSPQGKPVEIAVREDASLEVRDRGPGIPAEHRVQIFERFWRARKSAGEGAGLGLSIVRAIAEGHHGTVAVAENPGGGAVFRLAFPLTPTPTR
jgi:signal transduction histidine kinase